MFATINDCRFHSTENLYAAIHVHLTMMNQKGTELTRVHLFIFIYNRDNWVIKKYSPISDGERNFLESKMRLCVRWMNEGFIIVSEFKISIMEKNNSRVCDYEFIVILRTEMEFSRLLMRLKILNLSSIPRAYWN